MPTPDRTDGELGTVASPADRLSLYWATLRRRWGVAVGIVAACVTAGLVVGALAHKQYDATAKVLIDQRTRVDALLGASDYNSDPERDINTSVQLITQAPVADSAARKLGPGVVAGALPGKVATAVDSNSDIVSIIARDPSPERAARIANAFAVAYREFRARSAQAAIEDAVVSAEQRAANLPPGADRDAVEAELRRFRAAAAVQTGGVQIVRRASAASAVATPRLLSGVILSGFLGLVLASIAIFALARTDRRIRTADDLEAAVGRRVLATVPIWYGAGAVTPTLDALATAALTLTVRDARSSDGRAPSPSILLVTSAGPGEGAAEVALGLASAMADMGQRVVAIEGDLRAPAFAGLLGLDSEAGLGEVLDGSATLDDTLVEIGSQREGGASAWALPAGPPTPLPQPLLAGNRMRAVVAHARQRADVVIISGPPAATSGDSLALAVLAQGVLLVARLDVSRRDDVAHAVQALDDPDGRLVGAVATTGPAAWLSPADLAHLARRRPRLGAGWRRAAPDGRANGAGGAAVEREEVTVR